MVIKLHRYDEIAKGLTVERNVLMQRLKEMQEKINDLEGKKKTAKKPAKKKAAKKSSKKK